MKSSVLAPALLLISFSALGQTPKRYELSPFGGYLYGGTVINMGVQGVTLPSGRIETSHALFKFDDAATYGLRLDYRFSRVFLLEAQISTVRNSLLSGQPPIRGFVESRRFRTNYYLGLLEVEWPGRAVRPFVAVGAGAAHFDPQADPDDRLDETRFTAAVGVGLKTFFHPNWGLRFDARGYATKLGGNGSLGFSCFRNAQPEPGGPITPIACPRRDWLTNGELGGGIIFAF